MKDAKNIVEKAQWALLMSVPAAGIGLVCLGTWPWASVKFLSVAALGWFTIGIFRGSMTPSSLTCASDGIRLAAAQWMKSESNEDSGGIPGGASDSPAEPARYVRHSDDVSIEDSRRPFCGDCGAEVGTSKFCPQCGGALGTMGNIDKSERGIEPSSESLAVGDQDLWAFCGECGTRLDPSMRSCSKCGAAVNGVGSFEPASPPQAVFLPPANSIAAPRATGISKSSETIQLMLRNVLAVLVLIVLGVGGWLWHHARADASAKEALAKSAAYQESAGRFSRVDTAEPAHRRMGLAAMFSASHLWDHPDAEPDAHAVSDTEAGTHVVFSKNGLLAYNTSEGTVRVWDGNAHRELGAAVVGRGEVVDSLAFWPRRALVLFHTENGSTRTWDINTGIVEEKLPARGRMGAPEISGNGRVVATVEPSTPHTVTLWDITVDPWIRQRTLSVDHASHLAFSADGRRLASWNDRGLVEVWQLSLDRRLWQTKASDYEEDQPWSVQFSPDGRQLAIGGGNEISLRDAETGRETRAISVGRGVVGIAFNPDGRLLAVVTEGKNLTFYDAATGVELGGLAADLKPVSSIAFNSDGRRLAVAHADGEVSIWQR